MKNVLVVLVALMAMSCSDDESSSEDLRCNSKEQDVVFASESHRIQVQYTRSDSGNLQRFLNGRYFSRNGIYLDLVEECVECTELIVSDIVEDLDGGDYSEDRNVITIEPERLFSVTVAKEIGISKGLSESDDPSNIMFKSLPGECDTYHTFTQEQIDTLTSDHNESANNN